MTIDVEVILFGLCMWASVATGLAVLNYRKAERVEHMLIITMLGIRRVAKGEATLSLNSDGSIKFEGAK